MCGITGIVADNVQRYRSNLAAMTAALQHRGPDAQGTHMFAQCGLGHRRLSIVDLATGDQPMLARNGALGIIFNGEIYGYRAIRARCSGYAFQTTSDTEVILALYEEYGTDLAYHLPGMFAFAVWDDRAQQLVCARDRFGEKPFYYAYGTGGEFLFASEIKAILASGLVEGVLDRESVAHYLQRLHVHPQRTIYQNIHTLAPAHRLVYRHGQVTVERYWRLPETNIAIEMDEAAPEFSRLLDEAVARQLVADVPVGVFLSGGLDSSTIVAYAARHQARVKTFSFGFETSFSELPYAREVAAQYATEHVELSDTESDIGALLVDMQRVYDEPFADSSNIPTYLISKLARQHVKVVLTGDGGDELLAGYAGWYAALERMERLTQEQARFYGLLQWGLRVADRARVPVSPSLRTTLQAIQLHRRFDSIAAAHYHGQGTYFSADQIALLGIVPDRGVREAANGYRTGTVDDALRMDIEHYMVGDILVKTDRASMASGLELRAPFLDVDFASFCISLPSRLKITRDADKVILRRVCAELWPPSIRNRPKLGFGAPVHDWLRRPAVKDLVNEYLQSPRRRIYDLLDFDACQPYVRENNYLTWILLVLSLWMEAHHYRLPASP